jgi:hypothetical protein
VISGKYVSMLRAGSAFNVFTMLAVFAISVSSCCSLCCPQNGCIVSIHVTCARIQFNDLVVRAERRSFARTWNCICCQQCSANYSGRICSKYSLRRYYSAKWPCCTSNCPCIVRTAPSSSSLQPIQSTASGRASHGGSS